MTAHAQPDARVTGYTIMLPAGWRRLPVRHGSGKAIRELLDEVLGRLPKTVPPDTLAPARRELERRLTDMVRQARQKAATEVYLPVEPVHGVALPASFIVSLGSLGSPGQATDPSQVVAHMLTESGNGSPVSIDGAVGARVEKTRGPSGESAVGSRCVDYVLPVPGQPDSWLIIAFSTLGDGNPEGQFAKLLVELFDAMISTFRWSRKSGQ